MRITALPLKLISLFTMLLNLTSCGDTQVAPSYASDLSGTQNYQNSDLFAAILTNEKDLTGGEVVYFSVPLSEKTVRYCIKDCTSPNQSQLQNAVFLQKTTERNIFQSQIVVTGPLTIFVLEERADRTPATWRIKLAIRANGELVVDEDPSLSGVRFPPGQPGGQSLTGIDYDFNFTGANTTSTTAQLKINTAANPSLVNAGSEVYLRIDTYNLSRSRTLYKTYYRKVSATSWTTTSISGLQPRGVYKLDIYFYTPSADPRILGKSPAPYYVVTTEDDSLSRGRAKIAMAALNENLQWSTGKSGSRNQYMRGAWCEEFYTWNYNKAFKNRWNSSFKKYNGSQLSQVGATQNIIGDHVRIPGHGFMLLAYDQDLGKAWTIEGNVSNSVALMTRNNLGSMAVSGLHSGLLSLVNVN